MTNGAGLIGSLHVEECIQIHIYCCEKKLKSIWIKYIKIKHDPLNLIYCRETGEEGEYIGIGNNFLTEHEQFCQ